MFWKLNREDISFRLSLLQWRCGAEKGSAVARYAAVPRAPAVGRSALADPSPLRAPLAAAARSERGAPAKHFSHWPSPVARQPPSAPSVCHALARKLPAMW